MERHFPDPIYGSILVTGLAVFIIDSKPFQRLKRIKQLGMANYVYYTANHCRFQHSLGVYDLAKKYFNSLTVNYETSDELKKSVDKMEELDVMFPYCFSKLESLRDIIAIAGLCHDIGHGPFSHTFDDATSTEHEKRSCQIVDYIFKELLEDKVCPLQIELIKKIINPTPELSKKSFIFQIISNKMNHIDCDKFDYLIRDSFYSGIKCNLDYQRIINLAKIEDNIIFYHSQTLINIYDLFQTRYKMHRELYNYPKCMVVTSMIEKLFRNNSDLLKHYCQNLTSFLELDDVSVENILDDSEKILQKIKMRKVWKCISYRYFQNFDYFEEDKTHKFDTDTKKMRIVKKIGYISGKDKNPLENIWTYDKKHGKRLCDKSEISTLISDYYQEYVECIFYCDV